MSLKQLETRVKALTSLPNPIGQTSGWKWTGAEKIQAMSKNAKHNLTIDYLEMLPEMLEFNERKLAPFAEVKIPALDMTYGMLCIGVPGSGKSVFYWNLLRQKFYSRAIIHDFKPEFMLTDYRECDWIINPYDNRHTNWSIWKEFADNPISAEAFFSAIIVAASGMEGGGNSSFFSNSASELIIEIIKDTYYANEGASDRQLWNVFFEEYARKSQDLVDASDTGQSVTMTAKLSIKFFEIMAEHADKPAKSLKDFFGNKNNIWLVNQGDLQEKLNPFFSGFLAAAVNYHCTMPQTKKDLTLYLFDEYPQMTFQTVTKKQILLTLRGFGGCPVIGVQLLDSNDKDLQYLKEVGSVFVFKITIDDQTREAIGKLFGEIETHVRKRSENFGPNGQKTDAKTGSWSVEKTNKNFLPPELIPSFTGGQHIGFIPGQGLLYIGRAPMRTANEYMKSTDRIDIHGINRAKIAGKNKKPSRPIASLKEKKDLYEKIMQAETPEAASKLIIDGGFEELDLEQLEKLFNPDHFEPKRLPIDPGEYLETIKNK
jgi:Type IV secretion-system coupling protein DNA-binding domain